MTKKSTRDVEFAVRLAIDALRREIAARTKPPIFLSDASISDLNNHRDHKKAFPDKHCRDIERAIAILKAVKAGYYQGEA
ncbi:MAG: hypothetical protein JW908_12475 [Anaerolineales bacterium]|nr:hypothetical protein [Anaerolineales bacterium]